MFRDLPSSGVFESTPPPGASMDNYRDVSAAVDRLPDVLKVVVITHYQIAKSKRETAQRCGINDKSVTQYLGTAHQILARELAVNVGD